MSTLPGLGSLRTSRGLVSREPSCPEPTGLDLQRNAVGVRSVRPRDYRPDHYTFSHFSGPVRMLFKWPGVHPREALIRDQPVDVVNGDPRVDEDRWRDTQVVRCGRRPTRMAICGLGIDSRREQRPWRGLRRSGLSTKRADLKGRRLIDQRK